MYTVYRYEYHGIHNHIVPSQSSSQSALFHPQTHGNLWQRYLRSFLQKTLLATHKGLPATPHRNDMGTRGHLCQGKFCRQKLSQLLIPCVYFCCTARDNYVKQSLWNYMYLSTCTIKLIKNWIKICSFCSRKSPRFCHFAKPPSEKRPHRAWRKPRASSSTLLSWAATTFFVPNIYQRFFQNTPPRHTPLNLG